VATPERLSTRALNRATLARQLLLERSAMTPLDAVRHLVGMQAQEPLDPYLGLWSRLGRFDPAALAALLVDRAVVRIVVMRGTIHLVTVADAAVLRPLVQPVLDRELAVHRDFAPLLRTIDLTPVLPVARALLEEQPRTASELRASLAARFPDLDPAPLAFACRNHLPLVQVPPRGVWGERGAVRTTTLEAWTGRGVDPSPSLDDVVLRYLAAFGPAATADVAAWSRLTGLAEVMERLAPRLRSFRDERGRVLHDVLDAPRPPDDVPAPPRFLPEYDNVLLSHADRTRFGSDEQRARVGVGTRHVQGTVLVDGVVTGTWAIDTDRATGAATLVVSHTRLSKRSAATVAAEGRRMVRFRAPDASTHDVRLVPLD
jgi:hypothetical protein